MADETYGNEPSQGAPQAPSQESPQGPEPPRSPQDGSSESGGFPGTASNGKAVAALVCGILAIVFSPTIIIGIVLGVVALVLGIRSRKQSPEAKATAGIVCGIVGMVFSVLLLLAVLAFIHIAADVSGHDTLDSYVSEIQNAAGSEDDEDAAREAADEVLQSAVQPSDDAKSQAADEMDQEFSQATGMSLADAGIDKADVVEWMVEDASYSIDDVVVTGSTATAKVTLTVRDVDTFEDSVNQQISDYLELNGGNGATSTSQIAQQIAQYVNDAMDSTGTIQDTEYLVLDKQDGSWSVEQSSVDAVAQDVLGS